MVGVSPRLRDLLRRERARRAFATLQTKVLQSLLVPETHPKKPEFSTPAESDRTAALSPVEERPALLRPSAPLEPPEAAWTPRLPEHRTISALLHKPEEYAFRPARKVASFLTGARRLDPGQTYEIQKAVEEQTPSAPGPPGKTLPLRRAIGWARAMGPPIAEKAIEFTGMGDFLDWMNSYPGYVPPTKEGQALAAKAQAPKKTLEEKYGRGRAGLAGSIVGLGVFAAPMSAPKITRLESVEERLARGIRKSLKGLGKMERKGAPAEILDAERGRLAQMFLRHTEMGGEPGILPPAQKKIVDKLLRDAAKKAKRKPLPGEPTPNIGYYEPKGTALGKLFSTTREKTLGSERVAKTLNQISFALRSWGNPASVGRQAVTEATAQFSAEKRAAASVGNTWRKYVIGELEGMKSPLNTNRLLTHVAESPKMQEALQKTPIGEKIVRITNRFRELTDESWDELFRLDLVDENQFIQHFVPHILRGPKAAVSALQAELRRLQMEAEQAAGETIAQKAPSAMELEMPSFSVWSPRWLKRKHPTIYDLRKAIGEVIRTNPKRYGGVTVDDDFVRLSSHYLQSMKEMAARERFRKSLMGMFREDGYPVFSIGHQINEEYVRLAPGQKVFAPGLHQAPISPTNNPGVWGRVGKIFRYRDEAGNWVEPGEVWVDQYAYQSLRPIFDRIHVEEQPFMQSLVKALRYSKRMKMMNPLIHGWHQVNNEMVSPGGLDLREGLLGGWKRGRELLGTKASGKLDFELLNRPLPKKLARLMGLDEISYSVPRGVTETMTTRTRPATYWDLMVDAEKHGLNLGSWEELNRNVFQITDDLWAQQMNRGAGATAKRLVDQMDLFLWDGMVKPIAMDLYTKYAGIYLAKGFERETAKRMAGLSATQLSGFVNPESMSAASRFFGRLWYFARDWTYSNRRIGRGAMLGTYGHTPIFGEAERAALSLEDRLVLARGAFYLHGWGNLINKAVTGRWMWQNPRGKKLHTTFYVDEEGKEYSVTPMHFMRDIETYTPGLSLLPGVYEPEEPLARSLFRPIETEYYKSGPVEKTFAGALGIAKWPYVHEVQGVLPRVKLTVDPWLPFGYSRFFRYPPIPAAANLLGLVSKGDRPKWQRRRGGISLPSWGRGGGKPPEGQGVSPRLRQMIEARRAAPTQVDTTQGISERLRLLIEQERKRRP